MNNQPWSGRNGFATASQVLDGQQAQPTTMEILEMRKQRAASAAAANIGAHSNANFSGKRAANGDTITTAASGAALPANKRVTRASTAAMGTGIGARPLQQSNGAHPSRQNQARTMSAAGWSTAAALAAPQAGAKGRRITASLIHDVPPQISEYGDQISSQQAMLQPTVKEEDEEDEFIEHHEMSEYTQRTKFPSTPSPAENPRLSLSHPCYSLPQPLVENFAKLGINSIYPWQAACLLGRGHLTHEKNLVYSAPTGGGKSLVADVLMLKKVIDTGKKAILVLPYVALVQEKMKWLRKVCEGLKKAGADDGPEYAKNPANDGSIRVTGFFQASKARATWSDTDIAVCTIEKANSLVNSAIDERTIGDLGIVVVDEMHMIDDEHRGYLIEIMVTKLMLLQQESQIVAMSATLSNTEVLARWLRANYYISKYKPIPIEEHIVYNNAIYSANNATEFFAQFEPPSKPAGKPQQPSQGNNEHATTPDSQGYAQTIKPDAADSAPKPRVKPVRLIDRSLHPELIASTLNSMVALALETANAGYGALVFCGSRQACQHNAMLLADAMPTADEISSELLEKRKDLIASLSSVPSGLDPVFAVTVLRGVGFHHAGLTAEERDFIAEGYDKGVLKIMVATCSLAAGINLPARRVILCGARMGRELVGPALLRQMRGRAGRKGKDEVGETYLCCMKEDIKAIGELFEAEMPAIQSGLAPEKRGVKRALLEAIATRLIAGDESIKEYMKCTLLYHTMDSKPLLDMVTTGLQELTDTGLLQQNLDETYEVTTLGQAIVAAAFSPEDGIFVHDELAKGLKAFVMDGDFHVFYMFTPLSGNIQDVDWGVFRDQLDQVDESTVRAMMLAGVNPGQINTTARTGKPPNDEKTCRIYRRAYAALQLRDLSNEMTISDVAAKYKVPRGVVQSLAQTCHGFAAGMVRFCQRMGWHMLAVVLEHMRDRLHAGAKADLLEMTQVAYVKSWTARLLWENGYKTLRALAEADPQDLVPVLMMAQPRSARVVLPLGDSSQSSQTPERLERKMLQKAEIIVASANRMWERQMDFVEIEE